MTRRTEAASVIILMVSCKQSAYRYCYGL